jgi:hypothetical protein
MMMKKPEAHTLHYLQPFEQLLIPLALAPSHC